MKKQDINILIILIYIYMNQNYYVLQIFLNQIHINLLHLNDPYIKMQAGVPDI